MEKEQSFILKTRDLWGGAEKLLGWSRINFKRIVMLGYLVRFWEVDQTKKFQYSLMQILKKMLSLFSRYSF